VAAPAGQVAALAVLRLALALERLAEGCSWRGWTEAGAQRQAAEAVEARRGAGRGSWRRVAGLVEVARGGGGGDDLPGALSGRAAATCEGR
jgi:hypothetical protein